MQMPSLCKKTVAKILLLFLIIYFMVHLLWGISSAMHRGFKFDIESSVITFMLSISPVRVTGSPV